MSEKSFDHLVKDAYGVFREESNETIRKVAERLIVVREVIDHETAEFLMEVAKQMGSLHPIIADEVYANLMREMSSRTAEKFCEDFSPPSTPLPSDEDDDEAFLDLEELLKEDPTKESAPTPPSEQ